VAFPTAGASTLCSRHPLGPRAELECRDDLGTPGQPQVHGLPGLEPQAPEDRREPREPGVGVGVVHRGVTRSTRSQEVWERAWRMRRTPERDWRRWSRGALFVGRPLKGLVFCCGYRMRNRPSWCSFDHWRWTPDPIWFVYRPIGYGPSIPLGLSDLNTSAGLPHRSPTVGNHVPVFKIGGRAKARRRPPLPKGPSDRRRCAEPGEGRPREGGSSRARTTALRHKCFRYSSPAPLLGVW
jgi:hypothetical protein